MEEFMPSMRPKKKPTKDEDAAPEPAEEAEPES